MDFVTQNAPLVATLAIIVLAIVIVGCALEGFRLWTAHRERMASAQDAEAAQEAPRYAAHTVRLEQRMRVLERIVTDRGIDVADKIEKLRDARPLDASLEHAA